MAAARGCWWQNGITEVSQLGFIRLTVRFDGSGLATCGCQVQLVVMSAALRGSVSRFHWCQTGLIRLACPAVSYHDRRAGKTLNSDMLYMELLTAGLAFEGNPSSLLVISDQTRPSDCLS